MSFSKKNTLKKYSKIFLFFLLSFIHSNAQISGKVIDKISGQPIIGASIKIVPSLLETSSGFDGSYFFKKIVLGNYTIVCTYIGYETIEQPVKLIDNKITINFSLVEKQNELDEVVIFSNTDKESEKYSLKREKNSENVINTIGAKTIELLPDITTAGVLQRISGVSLERNSTGEARYAIIRGMDQRYNYTLVNGIKIPSPDNKYRYVPMDMFPSDLLERLDVIKAPTPDMEGDAIGGAMNLVMKNAKDKLSVQANLGSGFSQLFIDRNYSNFDKSVINNNSPSDLHGSNYSATPNDFTYKNFDYKTNKLPINSVGGISISDRFGKKKQFGAVVSASYQNTFKGSNNVWFKPENQPAPGNVPAFTDYYNRKYNSNIFRYGLHSKLDYIINSKNKLSFYTVYLKSEEAQFRQTIDTSLSIGRSGVGTGNTYKSYRSRMQKQSIYNNTLQGENRLTKNFKLDWSAVYSYAKSETPDWSEYQTVQQVGYDINHVQYATPEVLNTPFYRIWTKNSDRDYAGYLNFLYKNRIFDKTLDWKFGGMYRDKLRENFYNQWDLIPKTSSTGEPVTFNGVLSPDLFTFNGTSAAQGSPLNPLNYTATEKIYALYIQANINFSDKLSILAGVRYEHTEQGWKTAQDPTVSYGAIGKVPYGDFLPSIHVKYRLSSNKNLRLSYFSAINRPGYFEYIPFTINDDNFSLSGNPNLKHATSNNLDFRYEVFPNGLDVLLLGAFYKNISNPIESAIKFNGTSSATLQPSNFGSATNYGLEATFAKFFGKIGISGNYTYTHSSITTSKLYYNTDYIAVQTTQTRPLQGQSPHIANFSLLYKDNHSGIDFQLAYTYTGTKIALLSPYKDLDYWQKGTSQLDFSFEKKFLKNFTLYTKVNNLLNTPVIVQIHQPNIYTTGNFALPDQTSKDRVNVQKDYYGQNYLIGIRYKY